ncbi:GDSL-type esterase/lipase family protein, partial [Pseudonocardia sp. ICBG601]|uniref:GDSL-type esterase/lipase family protein n=1 Tax=Pseudonocardia sp. ICBG601 TaxID=2846759 RepID=UPI001CF6FCC8
PSRRRAACDRAAVRHLVLLGDSTAVGLGDPLPGGGWRGVGPLLRDALDDPARPGSVRLDNHARTGARMADARHGQVPVAAASGPDVVVLCVGMNDTLRSDFDPAGIRRDCAESLELLLGAGATVLLLRFHDHTRVWPLPGLLQRALAARISALNGAVDGAVADAVAATGRSAVGILDLDTAGSYDPRRGAWTGCTRPSWATGCWRGVSPGCSAPRGSRYRGRSGSTPPVAGR